tara:strand:- start:1471 stop:2778 length:1308 start_codon:yes stop_codon:yes gene_type:complete
MNEKYKNKLLNKFTLKDYGSLLFLSGIFFLPSTLLIGLLLILPSSIIGAFLQDKSFFKDRWNYPILTFGALILLSAILQNYILLNPFEKIWDPKLSIVGLGNWLPFIWFFWGLQPYLNSKRDRVIFALALVSGSFPVLITGYGQYFFNWTGPFETLNGLIIWYQRPVETPGGLSGLFSNQNYAGTWLNIIWPFCIVLFMETRNSFFKKIISFGFLISVGFAAFLTFSRNAWLGLLTSSLIVSEKKRTLLSICGIALLLILIFLFSQFFSGFLQDSMKNILPEKIYLEFSKEGYVGLDVTRTEIFLSAIQVIKNNPIFGIGAASFPEIFNFQTGFWKGHSHNLLLELAISYGLPATIIIFVTFFLIVISSGKIIFLQKNEITSPLDKALWTSLFFFLISQLWDIQYFDGKISTVIWVLIAALKKTIDSKNKSILRS